MQNRTGFLFHLLLWLCLLWLGCVREEVASDLEAPPPPQFIPRSPDTSLTEQGVDAVPEGDYIYVVWQPSPANDLAGYRLYRQAEEGLERTLINDGEELEYLDRDPQLAPDPQTGLSQGFYYWVSAYDFSGNESALSTECYYRLMPKPALFPPVIQGAGVTISWSYAEPALSQVNHFVIRLFEPVNEQWNPIWIIEYELFDPLSVNYPYPLAVGTYRIVVDAIGASAAELPMGSEASIDFIVP
ncbi:MAG: hypothetical protein ABH878_04720 [bacterium]